MSIFYKVVWTKNALAALTFYCDYIAKDSPLNAKKVRHEIIASSKSLKIHPLKFQLDEFYPNNDGSIRRYFRWNYRIVYEIRNEVIIVLDVQHNKNVV